MTDRTKPALGSLSADERTEVARLLGEAISISLLLQDRLAREPDLRPRVALALVSQARGSLDQADVLLRQDEPAGAPDGR